jgi:hypothetical protein
MKKKWCLAKNIAPVEKVVKPNPCHVLLMASSVILTTVIPNTASAACTSPTATVGAMEYFTSENRFLYCDGARWVMDAAYLSMSGTNYGDTIDTIIYISPFEDECDSGGLVLGSDESNSGSFATLCIIINNSGGAASS